MVLIPPYQKILRYQKQLKRVLEDGRYKIVHSHISTLSVFSLLAATRANVPVRIAHSHSTTNKKEKEEELNETDIKTIFKIICYQLYVLPAVVAVDVLPYTSIKHAIYQQCNDQINCSSNINYHIYKKRVKYSDNHSFQTMLLLNKRNYFLIDIFNEVYKKIIILFYCLLVKVLK